MTLPRCILRLLLALCLLCGPRQAVAEVIDVTQGAAPVLANSRIAARDNVERLHRILTTAGEGARLHFPAGDYYFEGSAAPNRGSIESTAPGQVFYGQGPQVTRLIQTDLRRDFGFEQDPARKRVPGATVRIRHKGCAVRDLTIMIDPESPPRRVIPTAALQLAHISYTADDQIGIIETTGVGVDYLLDHVLVQDIAIGEHMGSGIMGARFFEVGIDIVGSGGHVRVWNIHRLDARVGIRLDNGNHCPQGEYWFRNIHTIGRPGVTSGGCFFDWVGGQAPMISECSASFTSGLHAGPLGIDGDRFEPLAEGNPVRRADASWDWLTWHDHVVPDSPTHAERTAWFGLPREAKVLRIGTRPRSGGTVYGEGTDFRAERVTEPGALEGATRIHWIGEAPPARSTYFVSFEQPMEYRPHDLEWGYLESTSFQEATQADEDAFSIRFEGGAFGSRNPDFHYPTGFGFQIRDNFTLNGPVQFLGDVGVIRVSDNTFDTSLTIRGGHGEHPAHRLAFDGNHFVGAIIEGRFREITFESNNFQAPVSLRAELPSEQIRFLNNTLLLGGGQTGCALSISGKDIRSLTISGNQITNPSGAGVRLAGVRGGLVKDNTVTNCAGAGITVETSEGIILDDNLITNCTPAIVAPGQSDE